MDEKNNHIQLQPNKNVCQCCGEPIEGRSDKKFCNQYCKSQYHYQKSKSGRTEFYTVVDKQLRLNRRLLKKYNRGGKATVRAEMLLKEGFNPRFITHYWKNPKNQVYRFVYEYGFLQIDEHSLSKFVIIQWQPYMENSVKINVDS